MPAGIRETYAAVSFRKQVDLATANPETDFRRFQKTNNAFAVINYVNEDDAADFGKGHEFATQQYPSYLDASVAVEKYLTAEIFAWAAAFGLGSVVKTGSTPNFVYTCTPSNPVANGIALPPFSYAESIRPGGSAVVDRMLVGCVLNSFNISLQSGPGRASTTITMELMGTGKNTTPSGLTFGSLPYTETPLPSYGMTATLHGVDYVVNADIISMEFGWNNNLRGDSGYFPGSGKQGNHQIRGRMEHGDREATLSFVARFNAGSTELTKVQNLSTGSATINLAFDANNAGTITFHQVGFRQATVGDTDGIVHVQVECSPQYHASNGLLTMVAKCNVDNVGAVSA